MNTEDRFRALSTGTVGRQRRALYAAVAIAFVCEIAIHLIARNLPSLSPLQEGLTEAVLLTALLLPTLYFVLLVPNIRHARQREAIERTLLDNERKLSSIFDTMSEGVALNEIIYDENGEMIDYRILEVNAAFYATADIVSRDVVGRLATDVYGMAVEDIRRFWQVHRHRTGVQQTELLSPRQGRWFHISTSPFVNNQFVTSFTDITERKQAENTLRESERLLRETQSIAGLGTYVLDLRTGMWTSSEILDDIFGIDRQFQRSVDGWLSIVHPDWRQRMSRHFFEDVLKAHRRFDMAYRITRVGDGEVRWVQGFGRLEWAADGQPLRMIGTISDITARKQLEEQFLHAQRLESIGTLASGIAHDLNNVLAPIMMAVDLLKSPSSEGHSAALLDIAGASARRGADIVAQVLSFSRGKEGSRVNVQIRHLLNEIEKIAQETFPKNIRVSTTASRDLWTVFGEPTQLHQVLLNLCINARDAMPDGGDITITADNVVISESFAQANIDATPGPHVLIQVRDTGTGIDEEVMSRIFDPFFTTKPAGHGTGLGLSTSLTIVKHHGGFLHVSSEKGVGTRFRIHLPAQRQDQPSLTDTTGSARIQGDGELVLVVDDEESVREVTRHMLEARGFRVLSASDGSEAVAVYRERSTEIAAVIMDMMMPVMSGATAIRALAKLNPAVRIIAVSGIDASSHALPEAGAGVVQFLAKPFSADALASLLSQVLTRPE